MDEPKKQTEVFSLQLQVGKAAAFKKLAAAMGGNLRSEFLVDEALIEAGLLPQDEADAHRLRERLIRRSWNQNYAKLP